MRSWLVWLGMSLAVLCMLAPQVQAEVVISESNEKSGLDKDELFFECKTQYCEGNKKIRYFWVYDELFKFHRKYKKLGKLSLYSKMAIVSGAFRRIFNEKTMLGFYVVKQLKDREILEVAAFQSDHLPAPFIERGQGTLGKAWAEKRPIMTEDVSKLPDYFEMAPETKAEFTYPIIDRKSDRVVAVFLLNSKFENHFEKMDEIGISRVMEWIDLL